jgi:hypothetical protein
MKVQISKAIIGSYCKREIRLDPAGRPVYCPSKAVIVINDIPLCNFHSHETMMAIEAKKASIAISKEETTCPTASERTGRTEAG